MLKPLNKHLGVAAMGSAHAQAAYQQGEIAKLAKVAKDSGATAE